MQEAKRITLEAALLRLEAYRLQLKQERLLFLENISKLVYCSSLCLIMEKQPRSLFSL